MLHRPEEQSALAAHALPVEHLGQLPPQSTSLSLPFFTPSVQLGAAQVPMEHEPSAHCMPLVQRRPSAHGGQLPPQSTSPSLPLRT
jgi:hypothetical protein